MNRKTLLITASILAGSLFSVNAISATNLIIDQQGLDQEKYSADMYQCQQLSHQVQEGQTGTVVGGAARGAARGAAVGAAGVAIAGGSGSEGAKVGAGIGVATGLLGHRRAEQANAAAYNNEVDTVMRNCMTNRGYKILN
ncbi:glycine zipper family protein [Vibrio sp. SS-MA-C1-2]|uniref:glycine zipper family protein n=1 Tax=Vibrio sp. SS-MA-C1-2 TaxID=2908646 RepID=UPI001F296158|nr:glycine zipper family protein [Vibrio sp. SS-MA-C1-2]UJF17403.1 glycine zipper family protein [Vibrio sp. SS-MA-C1-2]